MWSKHNLTAISVVIYIILTSMSNVNAQQTYAVERYMDAVFPVTVDYDIPLAQMILNGKYSSVSPDIKAENFPIVGSGKVNVNIELVYLRDRHRYINMAFDDILLSLNLNNYRPITLPEILAFDTAYPYEKCQRITILAMGSSLKSWDGDEQVIWLNGGWSLGNSHLKLIRTNHGFRGYTVIAVVRKSSEDN